MKDSDLQDISPLRIGQLAAMTRCSVPTIRYYEQIRLIPRASRSSAKQRLYGSATVNLLQVIRRCRELGFTIDEVRALVSLTDNNKRDCVEVRDIARTHLVSVREKITELKQLEITLARFIATCNSTCAGGPAPDCTIFKDLGDSSVRSVVQAGCCGAVPRETSKQGE